MMTTTRYELEVFKERLLQLCIDMDVTLNVDGFDYEFDIRAKFDPQRTQASIDKLVRTTNDGRMICD